jgi:hypothetical protein
MPRSREREALCPGRAEEEAHVNIEELEYWKVNKGMNP